MLFMVQGEDEQQATGTKTARGKKASAAPTVKVELDLDNAPFLDEPEPPPPPPKQDAPAEKSEAAKPKEKKKSVFLEKLAAFFSDKKKVAILLGGLAILLIAPIALSFLLSGSTPEEPQPVEERIIVPDEAPREDAPSGPAFLFTMDQFFVPLRGSEGELRFLRCRFSVPTDNQSLYGELMTKNIAVRDAIYYYLSNKPLGFLSDESATHSLKYDLISVINEHVSADKIRELYIEEYLVTGL